jgi:mannan polymerase II complex MNN10 subunit
MVGENYANTVHFCRLTLESYCDQHSYDLLEAPELWDRERDPMWSKVRILQKYLHLYDYIVWIDADIMITNPETTLSHFIDGWMGKTDMMLSIDSGDQINTGMWFIRNSPFCHQLLDLIYKLDVIAGKYHEQGVLNELYHRDTLQLKNKITIIGEIYQRLFNGTMYIHHIGDFNIHFLGVNGHTLWTVARDHYPKQIDGEPEDAFQARRDWYLNRYNSPNQRYRMTPPLTKNQANIAICTLACGDKYEEPVIRYGKRTIEHYCRRHGYEFVFEDHILDQERAPQWSKILLLLRVLEHENKYDYVVWFDSDIMIMDEERSIQDLVSDHMGDRDFLLCRDISGHINTGVWVVKNTQYAKDILKLTYELPELRDRIYEDQDVFNSLYRKNAMGMQSRSTILSQQMERAMNCCVGNFKAGQTFLIHFFSLGRDGLMKAFNDYYPKQKDDEHPDEYQFRLNWINSH